jgi:hypothetical protein
MRAVLAMGLLIALCAIAEAAPARRAHQHVIVRPNQGSVFPNQSVTTPPAGSSSIPGNSWIGPRQSLGRRITAHDCADHS